MITGTILLTFAASVAVLAMLSMRWTSQPHRWAITLAGFMGLAGGAFPVFAEREESLCRT